MPRNFSIGALTRLIALGCACVALATWISVYSSVAQVTGGLRATSTQDPLAKAGITILDHKMESGRGFKPGYQAFAHDGALHPSRTINFSITVPVRHLLAPGESLPEAALVDVFVSARAQQVAAEECAQALKSLARDCKVTHATGRARDKTAFITGMLAFTPQHARAELDPQTPWTFAVGQGLLAPRGKDATLSSFDRTRAQLYQEAAQTCRPVVRSQGPCAITGVILTSRVLGATSKVRTTGTVQFAFARPAP